MKRIILTVVAGLTGLVVGFLMSNSIVRPMISFLVPPELGVSIASASISGAFQIALPWAVFIAVLAAVTCWFSPQSWRVLPLVLLITATVVLGSLAIQRLQVARGVSISRELNQTEDMFLTIESLHLGRIAISGIVAITMSAIGLAIRQKQKALANMH